MPEEILKGIDDIDWISLKAVDVPKWLKDLTSPEQEIRYDAHAKLTERLADQGSDSWENYGPLSLLLKDELSLFIVPFLIELLKHQSVKSKDGILELLQHVATYVSLVDQYNEIYRPLAQKAFDAVRQGIDVYRSLLSHPSPGVKMGAFLLLEELGEKV